MDRRRSRCRVIHGFPVPLLSYSMAGAPVMGIPVHRTDFRFGIFGNSGAIEKRCGWAFRMLSRSQVEGICRQASRFRSGRIGRLRIRPLSNCRFGYTDAAIRRFADFGEMRPGLPEFAGMEAGKVAKCGIDKACLVMDFR